MTAVRSCCRRFWQMQDEQPRMQDQQTQTPAFPDQQESASVTAAPSMKTNTSEVTSPTGTKDEQPPSTMQETPAAASASCDGGSVERILFLFAMLACLSLRCVLWPRTQVHLCSTLTCKIRMVERRVERHTGSHVDHCTRSHPHE